MPQVTIVTQDKMIGVDGLFVEVDCSYPTGLWSIQWDGSQGVAELTDGTTRPVDASEVQSYIDAYQVAIDAAYENFKAGQLAVDVAEVARDQRNAKIAETDWWVLPDRTPTQAQLDYRQALRDLPSTDDWNPSWSWVDGDANSDLHYAEMVGVNWPVKP